MKSQLVDQTEGDLAISLFRIAANPAMVGALHEIMGGFCHQCRNTLNSLRLGLYLANRDAAASSIPHWPELEGRYRSVEQLFDRLQAICRPMTLSPIRASFSLVVEERGAGWIRAMGDFGRTLTLIAPEASEPCDFDPVRLPESLDAFVAWRARRGDRDVPATFRWVVQHDRFHLEWIETGGPEIETIDPDPDDDRPDALALPYFARVVSAHGGTLTLSLGNGMHLGACWPLAGRPT